MEECINLVNVNFFIEIWFQFCVCVCVHMYAHVTQCKTIVFLRRVTVRKFDNHGIDRAVMNTEVLPTPLRATRF